MPIVYETPVPYSKKVTWTTQFAGICKTKKYTVFYYDFYNFQELIKYVIPKMNKIRRLLTRAFTDGTYIYALNKDHWYSNIKHNRMLRHEVAHIQKLGKHRWYVPDLMNPTWLFRWSDKIW